MARLVVLWPAEASVRVGQVEASGLAKLGISSVALLKDSTWVSVVLEGWAFDPMRHGDQAAATLCAEPPAARLHPIVEIGLANAALQGETHVPTSPRPGRRGRGHQPAGA